ncbi:glycine/D-amino acid oxidase-like deaminating enzyme [Gemmobacter caeni]|jgi:glycine/D-amino acid oxidase-like deaminating enzyme|uniref:Glycine/D-amino acid oxidase-like deaminating enzyme n=1 Tax=Gemmobacter caeni TaxID=589035 RepID=A0A2T6APM9_9RHOB|nr:FAD-dependent oxidoreductase [Gemmobacter caeni]PTX45784.1 glycine/D-amino acid oxidase-like deaminating enzyme [Gemmobacter caeni]TWI94089.1 glycine/D-amino acid oxidase-like deaminating enzyme [Gemmobacter caeni]
MTSCDVTVRGGGIFGLACAWEMARRGAKVRLIEGTRIGAGASGGLVGALSPHMPDQWNAKKQFQLESLLMAESFWSGVAEASGLPTGYGRAGRLQALPDARAVETARAREATAADLWQGRATWQVIRATGAAWEPASPTGLLIHDTLSARLHPRMAAAALAAAVTAKGGEIHIGEAPEQGIVLHATGVAGLTELGAALGKPVGGAVKGQALSLRYPAPDAPQIYASGLHIIPHADGTVAIGSTSENSYDDPATTDTQLDALHARALAALPCLTEAQVLERWAGLRPRARSRAPMLGRWPGRPGHFIANGGFKIGFGMAPKVATTMADLLLDSRDHIPEGFRVEDSL